jgi:hypothetical protein
VKVLEASREITGLLAFVCKHHEVRLVVNEADHVRFEELPDRPGYFSTDTSGLMCPALTSCSEEPEIEKCVESWTLLESWSG